MDPNLIKIGTRGSPLALRQANWVKETLMARNPHFAIELVIIKTTGDKILDSPLSAIGGKGLFVKEIEEALLDKRIDLAVHSMKDMPGDLPDGLMIGAVPLREDPRDVFISRGGLTLPEVPRGGKIGTSSLRRKAQLLFQRPDLEIIPLRGNLDTRIRKIETENLAGIILAAAGIHRLGLEDRISHYLDIQVSLPAVGQGALALEIREEDTRLKKLLEPINHPPTFLNTQAERAFLNRLQGGCQVPIAGHAYIRDEQIILEGLIAALDGQRLLKNKIQGPLTDPANLGISLAEKLLSAGGKEILDQVYER
ncbi:MAG TPA: hydroxymethylbilane synthase [Thermodesulfobacteriota bacterium]|nr:hydroxymethylbilane synthase [Thermodesulfobacteriota bacterium]